MPTTLLKNPVDVNVASTATGLTVSGTAAEATSGAGAKPENTLTVIGTPGQATTGTGVAAGAGADIVISAGQGGAAVAGATRGSGGSVTINPGAPATGAGTGGTYGAVFIAPEGGRVAIGTTTAGSVLTVSGTLPTLACTRIAAGNAPSLFSVRKANTGMTSVAEGHEIANWTFSGYDGSAYIAGSRIRSVVDAPVTAGHVPIALAFSTGESALLSEEGTVGNLGATLTERLRITSAGHVGINNPEPTSQLHVNGGVQVGSPASGDMGTGTVNVEGDVYVNGTPLMAQLEEAHRLIGELTQRAERLEAEVTRLGRK